MILRDHYLLPCSSGEPSVTLCRYLPNPPGSMRLAAAFQGTRWVGGWDMIREVPRTPELAVEQGSVWVYQVDRHQLDAAVTWWTEAEAQRLGERTALGYGRVCLLHPFHTAETGTLW
jgi:hypothetical protein